MLNKRKNNKYFGTFTLKYFCLKKKWHLFKEAFLRDFEFG